MSDITQVTAEESVVIPDDGTSDRSRSIQREQKDSVWMKDVIGKSTSPGQTVVYPCAGTFATTKDCMLLPRNLRLVAREIHKVCF